MTLKQIKKSAAIAGAIAALMAAGTVNAAGDASAGKDKSVVCSGCHGADGNSAIVLYPSLAGQHASYIAKTLKAFQDEKRYDPVMSPQAMNLSEEDIADLAAYYESQKPAGRTANPAKVELGQKLYRGGDAEGNLTACIGCHGPAGRGNAPAAYPMLKGQHAPYTAKQLADYQSGARKSDGDAQIMRTIAARLTQEEIDALASYLQGLR